MQKQELFSSQNLDQTVFAYKNLRFACITIISLLLLWFLPITNPYCTALDQQLFIMLNSSLSSTLFWQKLCGWLNHPNENWLNLIAMIGINFAAILALPQAKRKSAVVFVVYCWLFFQLGLFLSHLIFSDLLKIARASPSMILTNIIKLSNLVTHPVKDYSENCFPAGHTFVLIYWAGFTAQYATKKFVVLTYLVAFALVFPRLISGAHWPSDVIFTITLAYTWLTLALDYGWYYLLPKFNGTVIVRSLYEFRTSFGK